MGIRRRPVMAGALALSLLWTAASVYEFLVKSHGNEAIGVSGWYFRTAITLQYSAAGAVLVFVTAFMVERVWPGPNPSGGSTALRPVDQPQ